MTDGPFAEGKEHLGGFTIIEAPDLDAALGVGRQARASEHAADRGAAVPARAGLTAGAGSPASEIERVFREEYGRAVAVLVRVFGDIDVAEEAVQDAFTVAVRPLAVGRAAPEPGGLDHHHRPQPGDRPPAPRGVARGPPRAGRPAARPRRAGRGGGAVRDDRLRLIFTCCHPSLGTRRAGRADAAAARRAHAPPRSRARSSCPSRRWPSGSSGPRARSATPGSPTASPTRPTCPTACGRCWPSST